MLSCKAMGAECDFVAKGETDEEVKNKMMEHVKMAHSDMMKNMTEEKKKEMMMKMDEKMQSM